MNNLNCSPYFASYYPNGGNTYHSVESPRFVDHYGVFVKCPFCGHRQDIQKLGANCNKCGGDLLHENVR